MKNIGTFGGLFGWALLLSSVVALTGCPGDHAPKNSKLTPAAQNNQSARQSGTGTNSTIPAASLPPDSNAPKVAAIEEKTVPQATQTIDETDPLFLKSQIIYLGTGDEKVDGQCSSSMQASATKVYLITAPHCLTVTKDITDGKGIATIYLGAKTDKDGEILSFRKKLQLKINPVRTVQIQTLNLVFAFDRKDFSDVENLEQYLVPDTFEKDASQLPAGTPIELVGFPGTPMMPGAVSVPCVYVSTEKQATTANINTNQVELNCKAVQVGEQADGKPIFETLEGLSGGPAFAILDGQARYLGTTSWSPTTRWGQDNKTLVVEIYQFPGLGQLPALGVDI